MNAQHYTKYGNKITKTAEKVRANCVLISMTIATDNEYDAVETFAVEQLKYKRNKGVYTHFSRKAFDKENPKFNGSLLKHFSNIKDVDAFIPTNEDNRRAMTVGQFTNSPEFKKGRYMIYVNRHAMSYVDGVLYGNEIDAHKPKRPILFVVEFTLKNK